jgi:hypothetical protein
MLANLIMQGERRLQWRSHLTPMSLIRPDRVRPIDRVIDYFGGAHGQTVSVASLHSRPVWGRDDSQAKSASR